ncbi:MAG: HepT-like ribonuclease domain-containing protein [Methanofastidiosum sp.]
MTGMRDKIVHNYFNVNIREVWRVARKDIPILKKSINSILEELNL